MTANASPTPRQIARVADQMADGCPSLAEAAYRTRLPQKTVDTAWKTICRKLGRQAA